MWRRLNMNMEIPCSCRGSLKYDHRKCVQRWCNEKGNTICESLPSGAIPMNFWYICTLLYVFSNLGFLISFGLVGSFSLTIMVLICLEFSFFRGNWGATQKGPAQSSLLIAYGYY
ncbi:hypothetical protein NC653_010044 [Populus alba x Populus x berolinensis]|uniref:RING-CH-type domain-containing protein n=1 Tax=Populus alba x Populus x berolinensis TaxID=444605 RepID=A0AAD6QYV1_9ROSI|nr:hypothetical protein NC653_010044 [Populus alba x Populus x berolinensis]